MSTPHDLASSLIPILQVAAALAAGGVIGIERTFRGRAAGFRTYALVCMGSAMATVIAVFPGPWLAPGADPSGDMTRVVQGILTGIGFLGAGIIVKHGLSVRGLTTAASIWTTAVIGILIGGRYYWEAAASVALVLGTLSLFHWIEDRMDKENFARVRLCVARVPGMPQREIDMLITQADLRVEQVSYGLEKNGVVLDYEYVVSGLKTAGLGALANLLTGRTEITSFQISPIHE